MKYSFIIFFIIFYLLLYTYSYFHKNTINNYHNNYQIWHNQPFSFNFKQFINICGDETVNLENFTKDNISNLYPTSSTQIKLKQWFLNQSQQQQHIFNNLNTQTRLFFLKNSTHPIACFFIQWIYNSIHLLPTQLQIILNNNQHIKFAIRISKNYWDYPNHFDTINTFMLILSGTRNVTLNNITKLSLSTNDIIFFPSCMYHHFYSSTFNNNNQLNFVLTISYQSNNTTCFNKFITEYPTQYQRVINHIDFI